MVGATRYGIGVVDDLTVGAMSRILPLRRTVPAGGDHGLGSRPADPATLTTRPPLHRCMQGMAAIASEVSDQLVAERIGPVLRDEFCIRLAGGGE